MRTDFAHHCDEASKALALEHHAEGYNLLFVSFPPPDKNGNVKTNAKFVFHSTGDAVLALQLVLDLYEQAINEVPSLHDPDILQIVQGLKQTLRLHLADEDVRQ